MNPTSEASADSGATLPSATDADAVRDALARLLADPRFGASASRRHLLSFIVEETLAGRGDRLKGVVIAQDVYGRGADFDQQADPIVRIEARRLRRDLELYYQNFGNDSGYRLEIPKGAYAAQFTRTIPAAMENDEPPEAEDMPAPDIDGFPDEAERSPLPLKIMAACLVAFLLAMVAFIYWPEPEAPVVSTPRIAILPFEALSKAEDDGFLARGLSGQLANDLRHYDGLSVYELPSDRVSLTTENLAELKSDYDISYFVLGTLAPSQLGGSTRLSVQLRSIGGQVVWSGNFDRLRSAGDLIALQDELSASIAGTLGQSYGIIAADMKSERKGRLIPSDDTYSCLMRAHEYRRSFAPALLPSTNSCLDAAVKRDPMNSDAWAMRGWVRLNSANAATMDGAQRQAKRQEALEATRRAVDLDPQNVLALQAYAAALHYTGAYDHSNEVIRAALKLRPGDPETLHQLGWRLAVRGNLHEGVGYIREALRRSIDPPGRYFNFLAIDDYMSGRFDDMLSAAQKSAESGSGVGLALLAIANAKAGSSAAAVQALRKMAEVNPDMAADPGAVFRRHGANDEVAEALVQGLIDAGWRARADTPAVH